MGGHSLADAEEQTDNICIRVALEYGWLCEIARRDGQKVSAAQIAEATRTDATPIERMMRLVTYHRYAKGVAHATYSAIETTMAFVTKPYIGGEKQFNDLLWPICAKLIPMIRTHGLHQFPDKAKGEISPF